MIAVPDEMLMAYVDGELSPDESQALEAMLNHDAQLRARLGPFVETRTRLAAAFEHALHEPIPDRLIAAIARAPVQTQSAPAAAPSWAERFRAALDAVEAALFPNGFNPALAASAVALVAVGAGAGWLAGHQAPAQQAGLIDVARFDDGRLIASGALAQVLERKPSGATDTGTNGETIVPVLSFQNKDKGVCREYRVAGLSSQSDFAGVACRTAEGTWRVALHVETPKPAAGSPSYQTASGASVPAVEAAVDSLITGDAFGKEDELKFLKEGWPAPSDAAKP
ncbi:hypothetical protein [Hyphomicrobium sp.]|uniref:hypothetical protein n=1 Tax=Hyphomicrobium sp. TaxID=82 RepID=UPI002E312E39|nr:hypothetical protein [Hyphomicrobium sp.]HEX2842601.1 hypothetical protein [Hyphomicrobium sp.]